MFDRISHINATLYSERVLEIQIAHKMGELSTYGLFNSKNNTVNVAEIITLVTFVHMVNFSWNIASRNKLNTGPMTCQKFYRTTLWSEWLDCMLHIVLLGVLGDMSAPGLIRWIRSGTCPCILVPGIVSGNL